MIVESLFNTFFGILEVFLSFLPDISWNINSSFFTVFFDVLNVAVYFLPIRTIVSIFAIIFVIQGFKISVSILKTVISIIPFF